MEHGSFRDDEVNRLVPGGDYGRNPVPGYNEAVPMTDQSLPGLQQEAAWSSGDPRSRRRAPPGSVVSLIRPQAGARFGRLRSVTSARNGEPLVTTDNGTGDRVLRVSPR